MNQNKSSFLNFFEHIFIPSLVPPILDRYRQPSMGNLFVKTYFHHIIKWPQKIIIRNCLFIVSEDNVYQAFIFRFHIATLVLTDYCQVSGTMRILSVATNTYWQRCGVATEICKHITEKTGYRLIANKSFRTPAGNAFVNTMGFEVK